MPPPPLRKLGIRLWAWNHLILGEKWDEIWVKTFFCSSPDFGRKMGRNLSVTISNSDLCSFQIFWSFWPTHFQNPAYATGWSLHRRSIPVLRIHISVKRSRHNARNFKSWLRLIQTVNLNNQAVGMGYRLHLVTSATKKVLHIIILHYMITPQYYITRLKQLLQN